MTRHFLSSDKSEALRRSARRAAPAPRAVNVSARQSCACGGGCPRCGANYPPQAKLEVSEPGDALEQEADRAAEQVLRMPDTESPRKTDAARVGEAAPSSGQALDPATRAFMEPRFGRDFSDVGVHTDAGAAQSAHAMDALAYTVGRDIVFGAGQFAPATPAGRQLIAHELAHVVQQSGMPPRLQKKRKRKQLGVIKHYFSQKVEDLHIWPNAWASIAGVQQPPVGKEVWDALVQAGVIVTIIFVAERKDIPGHTGKSYELGLCQELDAGQFAVYVLVGQESGYFERTRSGSDTYKTRIVARPQEDIASTLFHELLHAWFMTMFPGEAIPTGHTGKALGIGDPKFDAREYDARFLDRLQRFTQEWEKAKKKGKGP